MSSYFPLLPDINLDNYEKIYGSLTFLNYPNNYLKRNSSKIYQGDIFIGIYKLKDHKWLLIFIQKCKFGLFKTIERKNLSVSSTEMVVCIIKKDMNFPELCSSLPKGKSLRIDNSLVDERASFNYTFRNFSTSYQGEYPHKMANIKKGSLLSYDFLKSYIRKKNVDNYLLLMNLNLDASCQSKIKVFIYSPKNRKKTFELNARENLININKLNFFNNNFANETLFICSNHSSFIPLFLSIDKSNSQLSLEHTHPPSEMFIGRDKYKMVKELKDIWLSD